MIKMVMRYKHSMACGVVFSPGDRTQSDLIQYSWGKQHSLSYALGSFCAQDWEIVSLLRTAFGFVFLEYRGDSAKQIRY